MPEETPESRHDAALGRNLRNARERARLSLREVQELSEALAQKWEHSGYRISAAWLTRIENGWGGLSAVHLISLAAIYGLRADKMLELYTHPNAPLPLHVSFSPSETMMLRGTLEEHSKTLLPDDFLSAEIPEKSIILPRLAGMQATQHRALIGRKDRAMDPMIPPGSYVVIDTKRRALAQRVAGLSEFERPVYFLQTRDYYLTSFCELDRKSSYLTLVPHPLSPESHSRWLLDKEIDVIGTVVGVALRRTIK